MSALSLGGLLGACEVATIAFADEQGRPALAGVLLAVWALGSLLAGLVVGAVTFRRSPAQRYRIGSVALVALMLPLPFVDSLLALGFFLLLCGFAISPTLIAAITWTQTLVPEDRLNEGIAAVTTGLVAGIAPGAALVGVVVDARGASASFWVPVGIAAVGVLVGLAGPACVCPGAGPGLKYGGGSATPLCWRCERWTASSAPATSRPGSAPARARRPWPRLRRPRSSGS